MKKLITMTDFVLEQKEHQKKIDSNVLTVIYNYAKFIKQPLELWMFVPCDEDGNVLEEPNYLDYKSKNQFDELVFSSESNKMHYHANYDIYQQAKERCLFEGFRIENNMLTNDIISLGASLTLYYDIESLLSDFNNTDITLTQTAINQIEL